MNEFTIVTVIARPVDEVFAVLTDLERMPLWVPGMTEASVTSDDRGQRAVQIEVVPLEDRSQ